MKKVLTVLLMAGITSMTTFAQLDVLVVGKNSGSNTEFSYVIITSAYTENFKLHMQFMHMIIYVSCNWV